ncbi:hypothetical protein CTheo_4049 [Ceratobasidium theobromae]|uniref:Uncharacterized protein n=1 Tax=Ceratobasidium theobromae TaxID=1582974 RepID=A0A5N5QMN5_9AGAM|nr:hypothetical protein CTheo_4049 [Ceratobasidium theobromae]
MQRYRVAGVGISAQDEQTEPESDDDDMALRAHTSLGAPSSSLRSRIPKPAPRPPELRSRSTSPRPPRESEESTVFFARMSSLSRELPSSPDDPLFYQPPQPCYPLPHARSAVQRESMLTQSSRTMSSLYPPSSSSQTGPDSPPSPSTPSAHSSVDPVHTPGFAVDADDVSYRLRLLVRNNYFLPPAHAKPNHSELSLLTPAQPAPPAKTPSPTFRDLFRVGRPRTPSKPPESPKTAKPPPPVVRAVRTATCPAPSLSTAPSLREKERRGRVLVIRERIDDLVTAANSAEMDMRARDDDRRRRDPPLPRLKVPDMIDPTETVDLQSYQFPVQSSLAPFGGLAPESSIGAAVLADTLPPRPEDTEDEAWRKALLHKAVGLSMLSIPDPTPPPSQRSTSVSPVPTATSRSAPNTAPIGRSIVSGSRLNTSPLPSGIRSPGFATRSPVSKVRELPIGSGSSPASLPPPPRARTASKSSLSPASVNKSLSPALSTQSLSPVSPKVLPVAKLGIGRPSMLPVPKHTVRRALSTPMLAQKVGTAASAAPPLPGASLVRVSTSASRPRGDLSRSATVKRPPGSSRAPTPSSAKTPTMSRATTPSLARARTPSIPPRPASPVDARSPTPSPALVLETPEGRTILPSRDTVASFTSGSNYSDDDEIIAVDDDDEIVAVDDDDGGRHDTSTEASEVDDDEMRAPSRTGVMLRPDSRMTNATVVRPSFTEGRAASRMSNAMSSFGGARRTREESLDRARSLSPPNAPPSQRNSVTIPSRSGTLMSESASGDVSPPLSTTHSRPTHSRPLSVRRSQVIPPLSLQPPPSIASTVAALRSAPPPASTDFFDTVYTRSLESGLGFDSDSEAEPEPPMPIFVQSRTRAVSTTSATSSRSRTGGLGLNLGLGNKSSSTVMHFSTKSNPYLATDPNPYQGLDPRKPVTNTPPASQTRFKGINLLRPATSMGLRSSGRKSPHLIQHPAIRAGSSMGYTASSSHGHGGESSLHGHESIRSGAASIRSERSGSVANRAARSEESVASTTRRQNPSLARLDGLYAMHIEAERDQMRRITAASRKAKPGASESSGASVGASASGDDSGKPVD